MIEWKDPPDPGDAGRPGKYADIADELRRHPGQWARVTTGKSSTLAADIKRGRTQGFAPDGSFDAVARRAPGTPGAFDIYARFIG